MNARIYLASAAALAGVMIGAPCFAQAYGNGPQYSTPAEQAQTRQLNEDAMSGSTQSPAALNGETSSEQVSPSYGNETGYSYPDQQQDAGNPEARGGYAGEPSSSYPDQNMRGYGNGQDESSPGYYAQPPSAYGSPQSTYPYGPTPDPNAAPANGSGGGFQQQSSIEQRQPSRDQLRYESEAARYQQQQAQYRRDQQRYRSALDDYNHAMDDWYYAPGEAYP